ncbi:MAG: hypothetical protein IT289_07220 [Oligoflexia bacterium]|nr:hypothetical protein [Oligoflexia bacterium]
MFGRIVAGLITLLLAPKLSAENFACGSGRTHWFFKVIVEVDFLNVSRSKATAIKWNRVDQDFYYQHHLYASDTDNEKTLTISFKPSQEAARLLFVPSRGLLYYIANDWDQVYYEDPFDCVPI